VVGESLTRAEARRPLRNGRLSRPPPRRVAPSASREEDEVASAASGRSSLVVVAARMEPVAALRHGLKLV
jgi:hypothetical protein